MLALGIVMAVWGMSFECHALTKSSYLMITINVVALVLLLLLPPLIIVIVVIECQKRVASREHPKRSRFQMFGQVVNCIGFFFPGWVLDLCKFDSSRMIEEIECG